MVVALNTKDMYFELTFDSGNNRVSDEVKGSESEHPEYVYVMKPGEYMSDFVALSQGIKRRY
jgi:YidC/Oxa1 family membrane protein insertase